MEFAILIIVVYLFFYLVRLLLLQRLPFAIASIVIVCQHLPIIYLLFCDSCNTKNDLIRWITTNAIFCRIDYKFSEAHSIKNPYLSFDLLLTRIFLSFLLFLFLLCLESSLRRSIFRAYCDGISDWFAVCKIHIESEWNCSSLVLSVRNAIRYAQIILELHHCHPL